MTRSRRVLVLGGTTEAFALADKLAARPDLAVVSSLAGRTRTPSAPAGALRIGGFGGTEGLARYLHAEAIDAVVDATHPFAAQMQRHAVSASEQQGVPRVRLERAPWSPVPGDDWRSVPDLSAALPALDGAERVFLTTGRMGLEVFAPLRDLWFLVRCIEAPEPMPLARSELVLARGPFHVDGERALLIEHRIDTVVTKNSGADATAAKLVAARDLGVNVVMVERPPPPPGPIVRTVRDAIAWLVDALPNPDAAAAGDLSA